MKYQTLDLQTFDKKEDQNQHALRSTLSPPPRLLSFLPWLLAASIAGTLLGLWISP